MRKYLLALFVIAQLAACGTPTQKMSSTQSGNPEVIIENQSIEVVKAALLDRLVNAGYQIDTETNSSLVVSKEMTGMQETLMRMAISNASSTPVRAVTAFTILKNATGVKVFAKNSVTSTMPLGQVRKQDIDNAAAFNSTQESLNRLKASLDR